MRQLTSSLLVTALLGISSNVLAQTSDTSFHGADSTREKRVSRNDVSPLVVAGSAEGLGAGLQLDASILALRGSFAYAPMPATSASDDYGTGKYLDTLHSYQANADLLVFFWAPTPHSRIGFSGGYRYNSILGQGAALGLHAEADLQPHITLFASLSTAYFPKGWEQASAALDRPEEHPEFTFGSTFLSGAGLGLRFPL